MKTTKLLLIFFTAALILTSCQSDDVTPGNSDGSWKLQSTDLELKYAGKPAEKKSEDLSKKGLFLDMNSNGSFSSNSLFSMSLEDYSAKDTVSGTYTIADGYFDFKYADQSSKTDVHFFIKASSVSKNKLVLVIDKEALIKTVEASAVSNEDAARVALLLALIEQYKLTLNFEKS
jgi:hypothetical protein